VPDHLDDMATLRQPAAQHLGRCIALLYCPCRAARLCAALKQGECVMQQHRRRERRQLTARLSEPGLVVADLSCVNTQP
jgi:hypothetical protein